MTCHPVLISTDVDTMTEQSIKVEHEPPSFVNATSLEQFYSAALPLRIEQALSSVLVVDKLPGVKAALGILPDIIRTSLRTLAQEWRQGLGPLSAKTIDSYEAPQKSSQGVVSVLESDTWNSPEAQLSAQPPPYSEEGFNAFIEYFNATDDSKSLPLFSNTFSQWNSDAEKQCSDGFQQGQSTGETVTVPADGSKIP
jgi:hypothetical protein